MKQGQPGRTGKCLGQSKTKGMKEKGLKKHSGSSMKRAWSIGGETGGKHQAAHRVTVLSVHMGELRATFLSSLAFGPNVA